jgi:uncharacterized protein (TIGR03435 family)
MISITPNKSGIRWRTIQTGPNKVRATNETLACLIEEAYKVDADQISQAPDWVSSERFELLLQQWRIQLHLDRFFERSCSDSFKLSFHREIKPVSVYVLVIAANGPKLTDQPPLMQIRIFGIIRADEGDIAGREVPIATLAKILSEQFHQTVLDETGLDHHYDITLQWQPNRESSVVAVSESLEG